MTEGEDQSGNDPRETAQSQVKSTDPDLLSRNLLLAFDRGTRALAQLLDGANLMEGPYGLADQIRNAGKALGAVSEKWVSDPQKLALAQTRLVNDFIELWGRSYRRFFGEEVAPVIEPEPGDMRFRDPEWNDNPLFDFLKQAYLLSSHWAENIVEHTEGMDEPHKKRAEFYLQQILTALSPSNFPFTNPEVIRETLSSNAENLVRGMSKFLEDLERSGDLLKIRQTDLDAFKIGENLAITPGKVVYQNALFQLIQYTPSTETVHEMPLLIVPPWINKYYILDLVPQKSLVRWLVEQGFTVFMISWVNPTSELAEKTFENYMCDGVVEAARVVAKICGTDQVNALGYCVGGTLLGVSLAYLAQTGQTPIRAAGFLTTQLDFTKAGDLLIFIDDVQLAELDEMMAERGYLDGSRMAAVFNFLRPRDLIWPYVVNNYLLGKEPFPFDLLYWNSDSTRMPAANHSFYLREFYHKNSLAGGEMEIGGVRLDLGQITIPVYELATREDHIAPAHSVFTGAQMLGGPVRFVLAGSGHIAGVINPPFKQKYVHWILDSRPLTEFASLEDWIDAAEERPGSWWPDFANWLRAYSGDQVDARLPGTEEFPAIEDAPGSYVLG